MFNVTKSLKKLIECSIGDGKKHCNGYVTFAELNAIFQAGQEDEPETMIATACNELMKRVASIEERLARLEKRMNNADPIGGLFGEPEKPVTEECVAYEEKRMKVMEKHCNPDTTTEAKSSWQPLVDIYKERAEFYLTKLCWKWQDIAYLLDYVFHCGITPKLNDDKPSEFISIPRDVAEKYIRYVEAKDAPEAIEYYRSRQDVIDTIKQQLG